MTVGNLSISKKSFRTLPVQNKRVLVRVDFNVPFDANGQVSDDSRVRASLPTIEALVKQNAKVILVAHLGRPKGQVNPKYSLKSVAPVLSQLLHKPVAFAEDCIGPKAKEAVAKLQPGDVLLLENLRFHPEEEKNDPAFAKQLAELADVFVQDAFGAVHRAHASTSAVASLLPSAAGALLEKELSFLSKIRDAAEHPYVALLGGAKVADKIGVVDTFMKQVDALFIGGAMAYTFLKANGAEIGDSLFQADQVEYCKGVIEKANARGVGLILPLDHVIVQDIEKPEAAKITDGINIPAGWKGVDVGPKTIVALRPQISAAKTIFWNGPCGIFEKPAYAKGTMALAKMVAERSKTGGLAVVGGGDSVAAVTQAGVATDISFISTGGGASLEFLEGQELPGVTALPEA